MTHFRNVMLILFVAAAIYYLFFREQIEGFVSGALVQLMTSRPNYGWYDHMQYADPWLAEARLEHIQDKIRYPYYYPQLNPNMNRYIRYYPRHSKRWQNPFYRWF